MEKTQQTSRPSIVPQNQAQPKRISAMTALIQTAFAGKIKALEIGVWYGIGSTNIWLNNLQAGSELTLVDAWRPYASQADVSGVDFRPSHWDYAKMDSLSTEAFLSAFLNVKKFENECGDRDIDVSLIRGNSGKLLSRFKDESFDFIYIDADHKYDSVKRDIVNAKRLINKEYGIICGDDLEKLPTPGLVELARQYKDRDFIKGDYGYHPGVCLAVAEEFEQVSMIDGFWWVVCKNGSYSHDALDLGAAQL
ncbi:class I SAM-dependent methyltransferase [Paraburkholderia sp. BCC1884]|uniref:class I SAM-dependent methyltransferase n=1 Tax=Paraburkholderia sp. BCC1884 TaxID=2562668 RepID=UPI001642573B|nr:class I SAM-dependent methyltransferase [Paraburkholderia sp. BCC1884]